VYAMKVFVKNDGFLKIGMYGEVKFNYEWRIMNYECGCYLQIAGNSMDNDF
jgi:hypothetical protein